jgi:hypothetical protein
MVTKDSLRASLALDRGINIMLISINCRYFENDRALEATRYL